jgi:hypothetical protein
MSHPKVRLTITVDPYVARAGTKAVAAGLASSFSAWVNDALADRVEKERRLQALREAIASYETEFGVISDEAVRRQERADRAAARVVRGPKRTA